jgi:hypothetical protein
MLELLATVGFFAACWYGYKGWIIRSAGPKAIRKPLSTENLFEWPDEGNYHCEIVGESFYQPAIKRLAGTDNEHVNEKEFKAFIVPDNDNRHDDRAVRIDIEGMTVGHLSREDARSFRRRLKSKNLTDQITLCKALIVGGDGWNGNPSFYGVCLNIKEFE